MSLYLKPEALCDLKIKGAALTKKSVLVIDDDPNSRLLSKTILEIDNYVVATANSGGEGLAMLAQAERPSLILLDMRLGDMLGTDFLLALENKQPEVLKSIPVVFFTGVNKAPAEVRVTGFISKDLEIDDFLKTVGNYIEAGVGPAQLKN